ncbi:hypothetical protein CR513_38739, partial [Mucuna pruriens]
MQFIDRTIRSHAIRITVMISVPTHVSDLVCFVLYTKLICQIKRGSGGHSVTATMAMAKFFAAMILALIAISMLQTLVMAANGQEGHLYDNKNAHHNARGDVARPNTTSPACFSVRSAAGNACVCPRGIMVIKPCALATTIGRPRKEDPSALELHLHQPFLFSIYLFPSLCPFIALAYFPTIYMS